ncbi:uncharacterized protein LOC132617354 [Lycium barbarum]|uniref:uncharacterized protein LOC132617354 n=1 Tax=Lycium barbarum TaxID=112863 RepID=UPI00293EAB64|nr:uncharacterized protein LOC132617354 [Lycium barbarum]
MPRTGMLMTCSQCGGKNHNKRDCQRRGTWSAFAASQASTTSQTFDASQTFAASQASTASQTNDASQTFAASQTTAASNNVPRPRRRPRKAPVVPETPPRPRGRPRKDPNVPSAPPRPRGRPRKEPAVATPKPRGRPRKEPAVATLKPRGSPKKVTEAVASPAPAVLKRVDYEGLPSYPNKRSKTVGMRVFVAESGYTSLNHGMPTSRVLNFGGKHQTSRPIRSAEVTGDLGHKARQGMRYKGKPCYSRSMLDEIRRDKLNKATSSKGNRLWK